MTISQPSSLIYNIDVPEIKSFSGKFQYNFFVSDETVNDIPTNLLTLVDFFLQFIGRELAKLVELKSPRNVYFTWTNPSITKNEISLPYNRFSNLIIHLWRAIFSRNLGGKTADSLRPKTCLLP